MRWRVNQIEGEPEGSYVAASLTEFASFAAAGVLSCCAVGKSRVSLANGVRVWREVFVGVDPKAIAADEGETRAEAPLTAAAISK
jgi:hypothetical protein